MKKVFQLRATGIYRNSALIGTVYSKKIFIKRPSMEDIKEFKNVVCISGLYGLDSSKDIKFEVLDRELEEK